MTLQLRNYLLLTTACLLLAGESANANLVLRFSGSAGSNLVNWVASGSVRVTTATAAQGSTSVSRAPIGGVWDADYDNDIGNIIMDSVPVASNNNRVLSSNITLRVNGAPEAVYDTMDLSALVGNDNIQPDPTTSQTFPMLNVNDEVSWDGSGTLTLNGQTFDTFFNPGVYSNSIDGGSYIVQVVPEPNAFWLLTLVGVGLAWARKLRGK